MSKIAVSGNASGTGTLTIAAPNTNTDRTLTLPDNSGTVLTSASDLAGVTGVGKVLQVVSVKTAALSFSSTSASFVTIGLSASITPSSATSKIFILATYKLDTQSSNMSVDSTVFRDATDLGLNFGHYAASAGYLATTVALPILDSPATTSSVTYSVRAKVAAGAGTMSSAAPSTITLMEIAA